LCDRVAILRRGQLQKVDSIRNLTRQRWMFVSTPDRIDVDTLAQVEGVTSVMRTTEGYRLQLSGSPDRLIKFLAQHQIDDVRIEEPSLEDVFVGIYNESV
jgi:ABC-2 type transport system ATP-binding protein